jgi:hypothetical protein
MLRSDLVAPALVALSLLAAAPVSAQDTATTAVAAQVPGTGTALPRTAAPAGATVYFIAPKDGETVSSPVTVRFGLKGIGVAPAGITVANTGHHHLLVDAASLPPSGAPIPNDAHHRHFGGGQTETVLDLPAGEHTLQLLLGDALHVPHDPPIVSPRITINVR